MCCVEQLTKTVAELTTRSKEHKKPPQRRQMKCWTCRQAGHLQRDCPLRKPGVQQRKGAMGYTSAVACSFMVNGFVEGHPISMLVHGYGFIGHSFTQRGLGQCAVQTKWTCPFHGTYYGSEWRPFSSKWRG